MSAIDKALCDLIDSEADLIAKTVSDLVKIRSVNPNYPEVDYETEIGGETAVSRYLGDFYRDLGLEVDLFAIEEGRENCVARLVGTGGGKSLIFNGHVDVVPSGEDEDWTEAEAYSGTIRDGRIWGRGSTDMKGGLVAQAFAIRALQKVGVRLAGDLIAQAVVGEEMMEHELGTTACLERGYGADAAIVSEASAPPFPLGIGVVSAGALWFRVSVVGKAGHTSMRGETITAGGYGPGAGVNAIDKIFPIYEAFGRLEKEWSQERNHHLFRPGHFAIHPGVIVAGPSSGLVPFVIPDEAFIDFVIWYNPDNDADEIRTEIEEFIAQVAGLDLWLREHPPEVEWKHHWPSSVLAENHPVAKTMIEAHEAALGTVAKLSGFGAVEDTTWLNLGKVPAINYGPGNIREAHQVNEWVEAAEVVSVAKSLALMALRWCGEGQATE